MNLLFCDTETTGLSENDRLIQVGYRLCRNDGMAYEIKSELFAPSVPISFEAMSVHHITHKTIESKPSFNGSELKRTLQNLTQNSILVAHNAKFDADMLAKEDVHFKVWIDTQRVAMHLIDSPSYKLQYLRYSLDLQVQGDIHAHDAASDVAVLETLFDFLFTIIKQRNGSLSNDKVINQMTTLSSRPVLLKKFTFGKYINKEFKEVADFDRAYLSWLYNSEMGKIPSDRNEDLVFTLQQYLQNHLPSES